jgi:hypothetical protein
VADLGTDVDFEADSYIVVGADSQNRVGVDNRFVVDIPIDSVQECHIGTDLNTDFGTHSVQDIQIDLVQEHRTGTLVGIGLHWCIALGQPQSLYLGLWLVPYCGPS